MRSLLLVSEDVRTTAQLERIIGILRTELWGMRQRNDADLLHISVTKDGKEVVKSHQETGANYVV